MKLKPASPSGSLAPAAFTLVEVLVTISIIAILSALLLQTAGYVQDKAARSRAAGEIAMLESALENYKLDNGAYPNGDGGEKSTKVLIDELARNPGDPSQAEKYNNRKPVEFPIKMLDAYKPGSSQDYNQTLQASTKLVDPFGNPYYYKFPGDPEQSGTAAFDLWSQGKKGTANAGKPDTWIKNW